MKKIIFSAIVAASVFVSCGESVESKADALLQQAVTAYETADYQTAKILVDSMRTAYPTAVDSRRSALSLMRKVEIAEQQRSLNHCNEMLSTLKSERDSLLQGFLYEKDARFQSEGSYIVPSQSNNLNVYNSFLRARVTESGTVYLTSLYRGKAIAHKGVKVSAGESFASCDKAFSSRTYRNLGMNNERLDFVYGEDGGIIDFISAAQNSQITVELSGSKSKYSYVLRADDAKAIARIAELSRLLKSIVEYENMAAEAKRHIEFVERTRERFMSDSIVMK